MMKNPVIYIGWLASIMAIMMYFSYIDQIGMNLKGHKGSILLPIMTSINCLTWILYSLLKRDKDWPIFICNLPGLVLGIITAITAI